MVRTGVRAQVARALRSESGQAGANVIVLVIVVAVLGVATLLLNETMQTAEDINVKAENIAETGKGINESTDSILQLNETNRIAGSILETATPLEGQLAEIVALGQSIDGLAASILGTAGTINSTAGSINTTARNINSSAAGILDVARRISDDVVQINQQIDIALETVRGVKSDTGNILSVAQAIHNHAACIDQQIGADPQTRTDGHC